VPQEIVSVANKKDRSATGILRGKNYSCRWRVSSEESRQSQRRAFEINGVNYNFSSQDNLSYEDLHKEV
jgi:hypothetical protein